MDDAITLMQYAVNQGSSQVDLVRAVVACVRAVVPLVSSGTTKIDAAATADEQWAASPSVRNALLALESVPNLADVQKKDAAEANDCLRVAVATVALAAAHADFSNLTAVMAVEFAEKAAAGQRIHLADIVTAKLL